MYRHPASSIRFASATPTLRGLVLVLGIGLPCLVQAQATVTINGLRTFDLGPQTTFSLDGRPISPAQAAALGAGYNAQVTLDNANATTTSGDATNVDIRTLVRGPVTSNDPLAVLSQPLTITAETVLVGIPGNDVGAIAAGDLLEVSGILDANGAVAATRIELLANPTIDWKLFGKVSNLGGDHLAIGSQAVDVAGVNPIDCVPSLQNGQFVEIESLPNAGFVPGSALAHVTRLQCEDPDFEDPPEGTIVASLEGIISSLPDPLPEPALFSMLGIDVVTTTQTEYRAGTIDDLDIGVRIEVEGRFDDATSILLADEIRFVQAQVRFEAPVEPADVVPGEAMLIMGRSVAFTAQTRDEDTIVSGLSTPTQVEVRGLLDRDGQIFATRVRERGQPDPGDTVLRGPVDGIEAPALQVLGIDVDASTAQFRDHAHNPLTSAEFFARVFSGTLVSVEDAIYDRQAASLVAGLIELEENTVPAAGTSALGTPTPGISRGTVTRLGSDRIFAGTFEQVANGQR